MKKKTEICLAVIAALFVILGASANAGAESAYYAKAKEEGKVLLYTSLAGSDTKPFKAAFEKAYPGVQLDIYRASGTTLLQKILTESAAGRGIADAILTEVNALHVMKTKNLLIKFESPERNAFDARFKDQEGYWTDIYPTVHAIAYNTKLVAPQDIPEHYTGLLDAKWKRAVSSRSFGPKVSK